MTIFRWTNCYADVLTSKHDLTIRSYLDDVIYPALATIEHKIAELGRSDWPGHRFAQSDMEDMLQEAKLAFGLSIQSIWERQLRSYLRGCAFELRKDDPIGGRIDKADWKDLQRLFRLLRGIELESFPDFPTLDALQQFHRMMQARSIAVVLANVNEQPLSLMRRSGFEQVIGAEHIVPTVADALREQPSA